MEKCGHIDWEHVHLQLTIKVMLLNSKHIYLKVNLTDPVEQTEHLASDEEVGVNISNLIL